MSSSDISSATSQRIVLTAFRHLLKASGLGKERAEIAKLATETDIKKISIVVIRAMNREADEDSEFYTSFGYLLSGLVGAVLATFGADVAKTELGLDRALLYFEGLTSQAYNDGSFNPGDGEEDEEE